MLLNTKTDVKRSGMILLIVVAFLSMFLVVGTTYLLVADSIRRTSDFDLNATDKRSDYALMPDIDPRYMFNFALGQILYDVSDPVLVGTKVVTTNSALRGHSLARDIYGGYILGGVNDRPFQGSGKTNAELGQANYIVRIAQDGTVSPIYDPERGLRAGVNPNPTKISSWNPPFTFANNHHLYLGSYKLDTAGNATRNPSFAGLEVPLGLGLDVKNLEGYPGGNDSYWVDAGFPVMTTPDGRKYKALIAPLILDLDGRINLNVAGNLMQRNGANPYSADHASNQGWGRWEINPKKLIENYSGTNPLYSPINPANEFLNLLSYGTTSGNPATTFPPPPPLPTPPPNPPLNQWKTFGRFFNADYLPININPPPITNFSTIIPHSYAQVDFNAAGDCVPAGPMGNPQKNWGPSTTKPTFINPNGFPTFGNGQGFGNGQASEYLFDGVTPGFNYHARNFNPYRTQSNVTGPNTIDVSTVFPVSETASILRWQGKGEPFSKSQVAQLLPKSLGLDMPYESGSSTSTSINKNDAIFRQRIRNMVTTLSADLDRPAIVPIDIDPNFKISSSTGVGEFPRRAMVDNPSPTINQTSPGLKLDLNRTLKSFPLYDSNSPFYVNVNGFIPGVVPPKTYIQAINEAVLDRTSFAEEIFTCLRNVTAFDGGNAATNRWFAQLAVNIIDYIDEDDFSTRFMFAPNEYVFGIELPRLVINEAYVHVKNDDTDDFKDPNNVNKFTATKDYQVNTYVELKNPLPQDASYDFRPGSHKAILQVSDPVNMIPKKALYKLVMNRRGKFITPPMMPPGPPQKTLYGKFTENGNVYGQYDYVDPTNMNSISLDVGVVTDWGNALPRMVESATNFTVSSELSFKAIDPAKPPFNSIFQTPDLNLKKLPKNEDISALTGDDFPTFILQKLAQPWLAEQSIPTLPNFNPYITIDTFTTIVRKFKNNPPDPNDPNKLVNDPDDPFIRPIMDRRENDNQVYNAIDNNGNPNNTKFDTNILLKSVQRQNPFLDSGVFPPDRAIANAHVMPEVNFFNGRNSVLNTPTFGANNINANQSPVTFLDRKLINPMELIHVPCCKPHEFTQMGGRWRDLPLVDPNAPVVLNAPPVMIRVSDIVNQAGVPPLTLPSVTYSYALNWPWFDENTRLYRFLEAVGVSPLQAGEAMHGRALGKVNVNTMHGEEVFQAVADAAPANNFTSTDVTNGYTNLIGQRPILSFGQANYNDVVTSVKNGLNKSLMGYQVANNKPYENFLDNLTPDPNNPPNPLFPSTGTNVATYARKELLTKIGNSVTTKSNVFAVWITTGYFEVTNDTIQPPTLGLEIGKADGINIRHRLFAIVDRTNMKAGDITYRTTGGVNNTTSFVFNTTVNKNPDNSYTLATLPSWVPVSVPPVAPPIPTSPHFIFTHPVTKVESIINNAFAGMILVLDPNTDYEETVQLEVVGGGLGFYVRKEHYPTRTPTATPTANPQVFDSVNNIYSIINRGNPGPWVGYDRTKDREVVPYAEIIE